MEMMDASRRPQFSGLLDDERSGSDLVGVAATGALRLHRSRKGNMSIFFIFMYLGFFTASAMVWNTGHTISASIHNQAAADAAAYNAAVWNARCVNQIVATNMLIMRHVSAQTVYDCLAMWSLTGAVGVPLAWLAHIAQVTAGLPWTLGQLIADGIRIATVEVPAWINVTFTNGMLPAMVGGHSFPFRFFIPPAGPQPPLLRRVQDFRNYQTAWINATPGAIDAHRRQLERYYGKTIRLTRPPRSDLSDQINNNAIAAARNGQVTPPLVLVDGWQNGADWGPVAITWLFQFMAHRWWPVPNTNAPGFLPNDNNWYQNQINNIQLGRGLAFWLAASALPPIFTPLFNLHGWHTIPTQSRRVLEFQTRDGVGDTNSNDDDVDQEWADFSVVATVSDKAKTQRDMFAFPPVSNHLVAPGVFTKPVAPRDTLISYAEAEVFHGISQTLLPGVIPIPSWRMWSTWGWGWEPRLSRGRHLDFALQRDNRAARMWRPIAVRNQFFNRLDDAAMH